MNMHYTFGAFTKEIFAENTQFDRSGNLVHTYYVCPGVIEAVQLRVALTVEGKLHSNRLMQDVRNDHAPVMTGATLRLPILSGEKHHRGGAKM